MAQLLFYTLDISRFAVICVSELVVDPTGDRVRAVAVTAGNSTLDEGDSGLVGRYAADVVAARHQVGYMDRNNAEGFTTWRFRLRAAERRRCISDMRAS